MSEKVDLTALADADLSELLRSAFELSAAIRMLVGAGLIVEGGELDTVSIVAELMTEMERRGALKRSGGS